ncbi:putative GTP cyclohydrolase [Pseudomonas phage PIP]|nr:putative GTP cyclohydrolase [Pseudomonas phage PIP]
MFRVARNLWWVVVVRGIPIYSHCGHHLAPVFGTVTVTSSRTVVSLNQQAVPPGGYVCSPLASAGRLTGGSWMHCSGHPGTKDVSVVIKVRHMCIGSHGICQQGLHHGDLLFAVQWRMG